jgi:signal transduction histidine kinase
MLTEIIHHSLRGLVVIDDHGAIPLINPNLVQLLGLPAIGADNAEEIYALLPEEVNRAIAGGADSFEFKDILLFPERGENAVPVHLRGSRLQNRDTSLGLLLGFQDLREIRKLTRAKVEAERMAAVGQTVSGLSHGIKNLVTALEGGMYMLHSGMEKEKAERIAQGIDMLQRNIVRISSVVKDFLKFAGSREIKTKMCAPEAVLSEIFEQFHVKAEQNGVDLRLNIQEGVADAPLDYECLHESLANIVGNAVEACISSEKEERSCVEGSLYEKDETLIYEVKDNGCGMDAATKAKVFSNFFTTKGANGTGLGLLMTKKIVQTHGGSIELESQAGTGSTFRILLPRRNLPLPA